MIQNLYQYEANKFYYSAGRSQINKPIYSLDSSSSLTNSRQYYLDSDGQIAVKMYKANTYYIKNINTVSESYTALTSNSINVNNTYYIDPEQDGIYKAIKFTNFDGSKGYYYLTKYIDSDVIKEQIPKAGASLMEGSTVRVYTTDGDKQTVDVPDVRNKTVEVATAKFRAAGLNVRIVGNGYVLTQDPAPGSVVEKGSIVTIKCVDTTDLP